MKEIKPKKCKECSQEFKPYNSLQSVCSPKCASELAAKKIWDKEKKVMKAKAMSRTELLKIAQVTFNTYIRLRDKHLPCISCGSIADIQQHAGHYFSVGAYPALRFNEDNVHKQCVQCNNFLHGNLLDYDRSLKVKIGIERYSQLYALKTSIFKPSLIEITVLIDAYKAKIKLLKERN